MAAGLGHSLSPTSGTIAGGPDNPDAFQVGVRPGGRYAFGASSGCTKTTRWGSLCLQQGRPGDGAIGRLSDSGLVRPCGVVNLASDEAGHAPWEDTVNTKENLMMISTPRMVGAVIALLLVILIPSYVGAAPSFSDWDAPQNLGCVVNSAFLDLGPAISKDRLSLYFGSNRPGGFGAFDIWVSQRASVDAPWGPPVNLGETINTMGIENVPALSRDGHWLFFNSDRTGGIGAVDIWVSWREHVHDDFGWQTPVNLGAGVNSAGFDAGASYFENEEGGAPLLFFGRGPTMATTDIYVSALQPDGSFGEGVLIPELSSAQNDQRPSVRFDGLELFLFSNRTGSLVDDLWVSTREIVFDAWETPTNLGPTVNSTSDDRQPDISVDRLSLFFSSNRPGGCGGVDLYMTTRTKMEPD